MAKVGVKVICYNFMPIFDWLRTDLHKPTGDGSTALFYEKAKIHNIDPFELVRTINENSALTMPGWEPERLAHLTKLFEAYRNVTEEDLWKHLQYFLEAILPVAEQNGIKMAIHPDDPPWPISVCRASLRISKICAASCRSWTARRTELRCAAARLGPIRKTILSP
ncbi:hypothetical protein HMSSN036_75380 [Paenibacillus macerans]|nr:hypothetical protein HMSSN036_75380 [Paenibacillus macerans]